MAEIVYGFASSHGVQLAMPPDTWSRRAEADRMRKSLAYRDGNYTFDQLLALRRNDYIVGQNREDVRKQAYDRCHVALKTLADKLAKVKPDVVVLIGDDQHEWFEDKVQPTFAVVSAEQILNRRFDPADFAGHMPGIAVYAPAHLPPQDQMYPVEVGLAQRIIEQAMEDEFDVTTCAGIPENAKGPIGITHSVGYIVRQLMHDKPIPLVPVLQNTFWPPNQAKPGRCYDFGRSIGRAIRAWKSDKRVAICASGGLSHYVLDEEWDRKMLAAMKNRDEKALRAEPNIMFRSGTSETKNWVTVTGIMSDTGRAMNVLDYVPCYRSHAGTGTGMAFATWE